MRAGEKEVSRHVYRTQDWPCWYSCMMGNWGFIILASLLFPMFEVFHAEHIYFGSLTDTVQCLHIPAGPCYLSCPEPLTGLPSEIHIVYAVLPPPTQVCLSFPPLFHQEGFPDFEYLVGSAGQVLLTTLLYNPELSYTLVGLISALPPHPPKASECWLLAGLSVCCHSPTAT